MRAPRLLVAVALTGLASSCASTNAESPGRDALVAFRPFTPLEVKDVDFPALPACADPMFPVRVDEARLAALARLLKAEGSVLLNAWWERLEAKPVGSLVRGPRGERWLVLDDANGCPEAAPFVKLDRAGNVTWLVPTWHAAKTTEVPWCEPRCSHGCGVPSPLLLVAEVPEGARVATPQAMTVELEQDVRFTAQPTDCPHAQ
ncbi:MAG: hypothetical protein U0228_22130 [Myxococcaceae bacterium]